MATYSGYSNIVSARAFEAETQTFIARTSGAPTSALAILLNTTFKGLKDDGVFSEGDCLHILGLHESLLSRQNWIKNAHNCDLVNNPTFTAKVGFTGDGATTSLNTNYTPSTDAVKMSLGSESVMIMSPTLGTTTGRNIFGAQKTAAPICVHLLTFRTAATEQMFINSAGAANDNVNVAAGQYLGYTRTGTTVQGYINGVPSGATDDVPHATALLPFTVRLLCSGLNANPASWYNGSLAVHWEGGYLNSTKMLALYTRIKYLYDNIGGTF